MILNAINNKILLEDLDFIFNGLDQKEKFENTKILITGCGGFLGYYFLHFFVKYAEELGVKHIIGLDNFMFGYPKWINRLEVASNGRLIVHEFDIISDNIQSVSNIEDIDFIIHMASIASPVFYRKYPIETLDANVWGLRKLLEYYKNRHITGFLFFSSSEVYGDPEPGFIPTDENYCGNVHMIGPRACYDEAKRFGETLCYLFSEKYDMPISIVRPFNNYGPGMVLSDKRVPADFAKAIFEKEKIKIYSDGSPTRTFCYVSDAILGFLKTMFYGRFDYFNIGIDKPEITVKSLANIYIERGKDIFDYDHSIEFENNPDKKYLTHNPKRRCPNINKARECLGYNPEVIVNEGVSRFLEFIKINKGEL